MESLIINAAASTNIGLIRKNNEDNIFFSGDILPKDDAQSETKDSKKFSKTFTDNSFFAVFDGMGGMDNGEDASYCAANSLKNSETPKNIDQLCKTITKANESVCKEIRRTGTKMGTTVAAAVIHDKKLITAGVGDSRVYKIRAGKAQQLTVDHNEARTLIESGILSEEDVLATPHRHRLTQHLGIFESEILLSPCTNVSDLEDGDKILVCSDGLYSMLADEEIVSIISQSETVDDAAENLMERALSEGGKDNITLIVAEVKFVKKTLVNYEVMSKFVFAVVLLAVVMVIGMTILQSVTGVTAV